MSAFDGQMSKLQPITMVRDVAPPGVVTFKKTGDERWVNVGELAMAIDATAQGYRRNGLTEGAEALEEFTRTIVAGAGTI